MPTICPSVRVGCDGGAGGVLARAVESAIRSESVVRSAALLPQPANTAIAISKADVRMVSLGMELTLGTAGSAKGTRGLRCGRAECGLLRQFPPQKGYRPAPRIVGVGRRVGRSPRSVEGVPGARI